MPAQQHSQPTPTSLKSNAVCLVEYVFMSDSKAKHVVRAHSIVTAVSSLTEIERANTPSVCSGKLV